MRIICLVPSLTETLIDCGLNVVGRTRFCIHPQDKVNNIVKVGGTKDVDWQKCQVLKPDIVIFDREENLKEMADDCPFNWHATHITSVDTIADELQTLADKLNSQALATLANDWAELAQKPNLGQIDWANIPGQIETLAINQASYKKVQYIIWQKPWMAVGEQTFIGSILQKLGFADYLTAYDTPYPALDDPQMADPDTFYLFSSEPYPFEKHLNSLREAGFNGAIVDGEVYSWFGSRSYQNLVRYLS